MFNEKTLLNNEVKIYTRVRLDGVYHVRFNNIQNEKTRYIRRSLKTKDPSLAIERAIKMYRDHHSRAFIGLSSDFVSIEELLALASDDLKDERVSTAQSFYNSYWKIWFEGKDCAKINSSEIKDYFKWRVDRQLSDGNSAKWKPSDKSVSTSTLKLEKNLLRRLFQSGYKHNLIARVPSFPERFTYKTHTIASDERRARFTDETYRVVRDDWSSIRRALSNPKYFPVKNSNGQYDSWSKANGIGSSKKLDAEKRWIVKERPRFNRAQYWFICILIANTGIRPSEVVKLKHRDISLVRSKSDGKIYTRIAISREVSKVRKFRDVIASDFHLTYERYLEYRRELEFKFSRDPSPDDWMFPRSDDYNAPINRLNNVVRPNLQRIGIHKKKSKSHSSVEVYYSAYSFRSWYITQRLKNGLNIYILSKNCGTSIATIAKTYDYSENWAFRSEMTAHLAKHSSADAPKRDLSEYLTEWK